MNSKYNTKKSLAIVLMLAMSLGAMAQSDIKYPKTRKGPKSTNYHGTTITDDYSWLDEVGSEEVKAWSKSQDDFMRSYVRSIPQYEVLRKKVADLSQVSGRTALPAQGGGHYFFIQATEEGPWAMYKQKSGSDKAEKLELPFDGRAATFILPSPDASHLALAMNRPGGYLDWKVYDVAAQQLKEATLIGAPLGDTRLAWTKDGNGFYYTGMEAGADAQSPRKNKQVWYHRVGGTSDTDIKVYTPESPGSKLHLDMSDDGKYLVIAERQGAATAAKIKYVDSQGEERKVTSLVDKAEASYIFLGNDGSKFYFQTDLGAPNGKIVSVNINQATKVWKDLIAEGEVPMMGFQSAGGTMLPLMAGDKFVVPVQRDLKITLNIYGLKGKLERKTELKSGGLFFRANGLNALSGRRDSDEVMAQFIGITEPNTVFSVNTKTGKSRAWARSKVQFNADEYESKIAFTTSKDGTRIPISLTYKKGLKRNGRNYMMMQVYGAIAFTNYPYFQSDYMAWLDMGGIHAVAHIRGGGAYGSQWHQDGIARKKQNGTDDYIAALEWAIKEKYSSAGRMVINGVSAGTIPVGAVMTQRPDLVGAVVSHYGMLDMIGYAEKLGEDANHSYMMPEIGNSADADDFAVLNSYSPYQKLNTGSDYPPVLALTSDGDAPLNADSYKYVARLQAMRQPGPMLLQMAWGSGHSMFGSQQHSPVDTFTDELAFLIKAMEIDVSDWLK